MMFSSTAIINAQELNTEVVEAKMLSAMKEEIVLMAETDIPVEKFELVETANGDKILQYAELTEDDMVKITTLNPLTNSEDSPINTYSIVAYSVSNSPTFGAQKDICLLPDIVITATAYYEQYNYYETFSNMYIVPIKVTAKWNSASGVVNNFSFSFITKGTLYTGDFENSGDDSYQIDLNVNNPTKNATYSKYDPLEDNQRYKLFNSLDANESYCRVYYSIEYSNSGTVSVNSYFFDVKYTDLTKVDGVTYFGS